MKAENPSQPGRNGLGAGRLFPLMPQEGIAMESNLIFSGENLEQFSATLTRLSTDYRDKPEVRAQLDADPRAYFASRGADLQSGADLKVVANTADVFHMVLPPNPNAALQDSSLGAVSGGTLENSATHSSISTIPSTVSSVSSH